MLLLVVAYDGADEQRHVHLPALVLDYGDPVQESLLECGLDGRQTHTLERRIRLLHCPPDKVRYYPLCPACAGAIRDGDGTVRPASARVFVG